MEHRPPISGEAVRVLEQSPRKRESIGDAWLFPSPEDSSKANQSGETRSRTSYSKRRGRSDVGTVLRCYQQPDDATMLAVMSHEGRPVEQQKGA